MIWKHPFWRKNDWIPELIKAKPSVSWFSEIWGLSSCIFLIRQEYTSSICSKTLSRQIKDQTPERTEMSLLCSLKPLPKLFYKSKNKTKPQLDKKKIAVNWWDSGSSIVKQCLLSVFLLIFSTLLPQSILLSTLPIHFHSLLSYCLLLTDLKCINIFPYSLLFLKNHLPSPQFFGFPQYQGCRPHSRVFSAWDWGCQWRGNGAAASLTAISSARKITWRKRISRRI